MNTGGRLHFFLTDPTVDFPFLLREVLIVIIRSLRVA